MQMRIQPYVGNPLYWQYNGRPVMLLGGSVEDNLFQVPDVKAHLDLLQSVGGNYVRCTMSSRDEGNVWPFERDPRTGLYDLSRLSGEYWHRFEQFLQLCHEREIVVQVELWDRFDFARAPWQHNPYNPKNNVNYDAAESGLKVEINTHPGMRENAFFRSVPALEDNRTVLRYQQMQIDKLLSISLTYPNVIYCIDNETNESPEWGRYWAGYIRRQAESSGVNAEITEMWDAHDLLAEQHAATFDHPETYSFVDVSQNNHQTTSLHWENLQQARRRLIASGHPRPMNSVKVYGANSGRYGNTRDAQERFWRNVIGGLAAVRFHRPPSGLGLSEIAQAHIRAARMFTDALAIWKCEPHNELLSNRSWNEAYCTAQPGDEYGVFFTDGGDVLLDVSAAGERPLSVRWLDIRGGRWMGGPIPGEAHNGQLRLVTPTEEGYWAAIVRVERRR